MIDDGLLGQALGEVDGAIAETTPEFVKVSGEILGIGQPSSQPKNPQVGMLVKKAGADFVKTSTGFSSAGATAAATDSA